MNLVVNGQAHAHSGRGSITALLAEVGADAARTAVMVNGEVKPRSQWDSVQLADGDQVELLTFAGGG